MKLTKARLQEIIKEEIDAVTEAEGPEKALGKWAKMFPRAAAALEKMGATIEDIKKAIDDAQPAAGSPEDEVRRKMRAYGSAGAISSDIMEEKMISLSLTPEEVDALRIALVPGTELSLTQKKANDLLIALEAVEQTPEIKALYDKIFDAGLGGGFRE